MPVDLLCDECGVPIRVKPCLVEKYKTHFCSKTCQGRYSSKTYVGPNSPRWSGGTTKDKDGYLQVKMRDHSRADANGYVRKHILVAEEMLGRPLRDDEEVHHKNEQKGDNRPENLQVVTTLEHARIHSGCEQLADGTWMKTCRYCSETKEINRENWYFDKKGHLATGRCSACARTDSRERQRVYREKRGTPRRDKLNLKKAKQIRKLAARGETVKHLAQRFGVVPQTIRDVLVSKTWKEPKDGPE